MRARIRTICAESRLGTHFGLYGTIEAPPW